MDTIVYDLLLYDIQALLFSEIMDIKNPTEELQNNKNCYLSEVRVLHRGLREHACLHEGLE